METSNTLTDIPASTGYVCKYTLLLLALKAPSNTKSDRTIQASIDEVYDTFVSRKSPDPSNYIALKQSPIAQTAIATARSAGWNHDNSSPLWIYNPMEPSNKLKFTSRLDVNDHSSYDRETAYPGYVALQWPPLTASKKAASIKASQYVLSGEYPYNKPMEPTSGGFVQIQQHLDAQKTTLTSHANVWGPISALVENEGSLTFSLRTRTRGISSDPANLRTQEWASYFYAESGKSSFVRFTHDGNPSHELKVDAWSFFMNQPDPSSQIVSFSDLDTSKLTLVQDFTQEPIAPQYNSRGLSSAQFMLDTWISTDAAAPDIISVTFSSEAAGWVPRITVSSSQSGLTAPITKKIDFADIAAPKMAWTHIKFLTVNGGKRLLLANAVPTDDRHTLLNLRDYTYDESTCSLVVSQTVITLSGAGALPTQVLVGDVLGTGFQQLVVTTGNKVQLFNVSVGGKGQLEYMPAITPSATATATAITGNTFFMALVPAEDGLGGLEILTVISKTDEKAKSLKRIIEVALTPTPPP